MTGSEDKIISIGAAPSLDRALLKSCIHCGLCLPACPTYLATGREVESPRGRIHLLASVQSGKMQMEGRVAEHIESCLGCLGCQTACPSGVNYEEILNQARPHLASKRNPAARSVMRFAFSQILPRYGLLRFMGLLLRIWQMFFGRSVMAPLAKRSEGTNESRPPTSPFDISDWIKRLADWELFTPAVPSHIRLPDKIAPASESKNGAHISLFKGCVMDVFYNHVNHASVSLLLKQGHSVEVPEQTCCAALAFHAGEVDIAIALAKKNVDLFGYSQSPIAVTSAGCGAMLKHYGELLSEDAEYAQRAAEFSDRVKDISEILAPGGTVGTFQPGIEMMPLEDKTTYHAACHLAHAQNVRKEPQELLCAIDSNCAGASKLVPLVESEHCCGSAGIYNLFNTELSLKVLDRKMDYLESTDAKTVVTSNPGCMLQLEAGIKRRGLNVEVKHLAEMLDSHFCPSYATSQSGSVDEVSHEKDHN